MTVVDREHVLAKLRAQREHIERDYGLRMIGIVGSVARGEARADSDVDIFADIVGRPTLFEIAGAELELRDEIGIPVELVFRNDLRPSRRARMERDLIEL
jgi:hypothetical protein